MRNKSAAVPTLTSDERQDVYRQMFLLNRSFHSIVQRLDELKRFFSPQDLKDMLGMTQETQLEINRTLLDKLESIEDEDWAHFGKVRAALERRLRELPRKRKKRWTMAKPQLSDEILTMDELAVLLKVEPNKIYEMTRKRFKRRRGFALPKFRVGRELRFRRRDVEAWIEKSLQANGSD
jgi:excisionase family DNA binding protein